MPTLSFTTDLPIISVTIKKTGQADANVPTLLDTGAGLSLISNDFAQSHAKTPGSPIATTNIYPIGFSHPMILPMYDFEEIAIAGNSYLNVTALAIDLSFFDHTTWVRTNHPFSMILGKDIQELIGDITINQSTKTIVLP